MKYWDKLTWIPVKFCMSFIVLSHLISQSDCSVDNLTKYLKSVPIIVLRFNMVSISFIFIICYEWSIINTQATSNGSIRIVKNKLYFHFFSEISKINEGIIKLIQSIYFSSVTLWSKANLLSTGFTG